MHRETGTAVPSRVSLLISILRLNLVLPYGIPPEFRSGGVDLLYLDSMREAIYYCPNNYSSDDDDKLVSIVAVSIFAVRSRKWTQLSRMDK